MTRVSLESSYGRGDPRGWDKLDQIFRNDDPTDELGATWGIKNIKRTVRGFRNSANYRPRTLLTSAARSVA